MRLAVSDTMMRELMDSSSSVSTSAPTGTPTAPRPYIAQRTEPTISRLSPTSATSTEAR